MKSFIFLGILFWTAFSFGQKEATRYKNWKTFRSDYGFEFKYPDCWVVQGDSPDEPKLATSKSKDIFVGEADECKRPQMAAWVPNGIGFHVDVKPFKSKEEGIAALNKIEKNIKEAAKIGGFKVYRQFDFDQGGAIASVEELQGVGFVEIRWNMELYCLTRRIRIQDPVIKNPDKSYDEKFKAGDLALPEPEKTIYESIKCTN
jgi:hypothetical protein